MKKLMFVVLGLVLLSSFVLGVDADGTFVCEAKDGINSCTCYGLNGCKTPLGKVLVDREVTTDMSEICTINSSKFPVCTTSTPQKKAAAPVTPPQVTTIPTAPVTPITNYPTTQRSTEIDYVWAKIISLYVTNSGKVWNLAGGNWVDYDIIYPPAVRPTSGVSASFNKGGWTFDPLAEKQMEDASSEIITLLNCMRNILPVGVGRISGVSDSVGFQKCAFSYDSSCHHTKGSAHYGCGGKYPQSLAVDFGDEGNACAIASAANQCGANLIIGPPISASCGLYQSGVKYIDDNPTHQNHLHISIIPNGASKGYSECDWTLAAGTVVATGGSTGLVIGAESPDHWLKYSSLTVNTEFQSLSEDFANKIYANKQKYDVIEKATGVPWYVVGVIHYREGGLDFKQSIRSGKALTLGTSWEQDAIVVINQQKNKFHQYGLLKGIEAYNGLGYLTLSTPINSPYLWSGSQYYTTGKFVDGSGFISSLKDEQVGAAVLLSVMEKKNYFSPFAVKTVS